MHPTLNIDLKSTVKVSGHVRIENGDTVIEGKNKLTSQFLMNLMNHFAASSGPTACGMMYGRWIYQGVHLGTDTTTKTNATTTALTSPIGAPKIEDARSTDSWVTNGNTWNVAYTAVWNPGSVSGTVGEIGLYLLLDTHMTSGNGTIQMDGPGRLVSRFAVADSEFTAFTIDTTRPVVISWTLSFTTDGILTNLGAMNMASIAAATDRVSSDAHCAYNWAGKSCFMVLGSDTTTQNTGGMTALTSPIGTAPGTKASTQALATANPSTGVYQVTYTATWGPGTISGTVGEIGLYLFGPPSWPGITAVNWYQGPYLMARLSDANGHFESFSINTSVNLIIAWTMEFAFDTS